MVRKAFLGVTDVFLLVFVVLNLLDFLEIIPTELDYAKKILSWVLMGYLLYQVSLSHVLFGHRDGDLDVVLIFAYFLLIIKNLVSYAASGFQTASDAMKPFFYHLITYGASYELVGFVCGMVLLVLLSLFVAYKTRFLKRSVMGVLHEDGAPRADLKVFFSRFIVTLLVLLAFYLWVFNILMEWLTIAVDALLVLIILLFYSVFLLRHRLSMHSYLQRIGTSSDNFFRSMLDHFRYKESILLGLCGLLVLHLLTDIGNFLVPYLTGLQDQLYFSSLGGAARLTVWGVLHQDIVMVSGVLPTIALLVVFVGNILGTLLLFASPGLLWYELYKRRKPMLSSWLIIMFFTSLPAVLLSSLFLFKRLDTLNLIGVDVLTHSMLASGVSPIFAACCMVIVGLISWACLRHRSLHDRLQQMWVAISTLFLGWYSLLFFLDVAAYFQDVVFGFVRQGNWLLAVVFFVFQALTIIFYIGGFGIFLYELVHRTRKRRIAR